MRKNGAKLISFKGCYILQIIYITKYSISFFGTKMYKYVPVHKLFDIIKDFKILNKQFPNNSLGYIFFSPVLCFFIINSWFYHKHMTWKFIWNKRNNNNNNTFDICDWKAILCGIENWILYFSHEFKSQKGIRKVSNYYERTHSMKSTHFKWFDGYII